MPDLTVQQVQRGRGPNPVEHARRKHLSREMRSVRERLTSSIGFVRAFDHELMRIYAQHRLAGSGAAMVLALAVGAAASFWLSPYLIGMWLGILMLSAGMTAFFTRRFLKERPSDADLRKWRVVFQLAEAVHGTAWALLIVLFVGVDESAVKMFVLATTLIVGALMVMLSASVPRAVLCGLLPVTFSIILYVWGNWTMDSITILMVTGAAQVFFVFLVNRLYSTTLEMIRYQAEKDSLITELETAKSNSDEARRKAEEANLAKSRFLATMSHELRTPLNAILGFSEVMKNEIFGPHLNTAYKDYSGDIHGSGQHLLELINEILDLSRIEAGKYELNEEALSLAGIVEDCQHMLSLRASAKGQGIENLIETDLPKIWGDERALRQIVLNILSNAIKFTPQGGEIVIKVGWTAAGGQYVSVKDNGPGIPEDEIPTVLQSFGRGSHAIKTAEQGSGLGLPIVKGLVDLHEGGFDLKSRPRDGTLVTVTFPPGRVMETLPALDPHQPRDATKSKPSWAA
jgi:two-component system cell cycle sensor histidine kinase PleC